MTGAIEVRINELWPQFDTNQIAKLAGLPESAIYNAMARAKGRTERKTCRPIDHSFERPRLELEELLIA